MGKTVVLLAPLPPPSGGIANWTKRMQKVNLKNGWKVEVVDESLTGKRRLEGGAAKGGILNEAKRSYYIWKNLSNIVKEEEVAIAQACIPAYSGAMLREIISSLICKMHNKKFIVHFRCTIPNAINSKFSKIILRVLISLSDCIFVLNDISKKYVKEIASQKTVELIPNFISTSEMIKERYYNDSINTAIYTGRLLAEKGCNTIIEMAEQFPEITFKLVGQNYLKRSYYPSNVKIIGEITPEEVKKELENSDLFLFLSYFRGEGFSNALAEAMASGLPCIVTDWAANKDMIGETGGIVVPKEDVNALSAAIKALNDKDTRERMGRRNRSQVISYFSEEKVTSMYVDTYEKLL